jgi:NTP pyrophosphatase (non-canonical NTP hydrolase)
MEHESRPESARPSFDELVALTRRVIAGFEEREQRPWGVEASLIELIKQVGDLARHVMMAESYYLPDRSSDARYATTTERVGDELADILYCVIRLADLYGIDLAEAQVSARRRELDYLGLGDEPRPPAPSHDR